ncbi:MAG: acyl carrier protein [Bacteroidota bacterium]
MTQIDVKREVIAVLSDMGISEKAITEKASFSKDLGLDSLDFVEMVMEFELRFDLSIPTIEAEKICTVKQAVDYLNKALRLGAVANS